MKRTFLLLLLSTSLLQSYASHEFFERKKTRLEKQKEKVPFALPKTIQALANNTTIATLEKTSDWDAFAQAWNPLFAYKEKYLNDLLVAAYEMNYNQTDTFSIIEYSYLPNKKLQQMTNSFQVSPGIISPSNRQTYTYANNDLRTIILGEQFDPQTQTWNNDYRATIDVNSRGMRIGVKYESYVNNAWEILYAYKTNVEFLNLTSDKILSVTDSIYNDSTFLFELTNKETRTYNANEEVKDIKYANRVEGLGFVTTGIDSIYYTAGIVSSVEQYLLDSTRTSLIKNSRVNNIRWVNFNPNTDIYYNNADAYTLSYWVQNAWLFSNRSAASYPDNYGSFIYTEEVYANNAWQYYLRYKELRDSKKNIIEYNSEDYNVINNNWELRNGTRYTHQYNASDLITETVEENYDKFNVQWDKYGKLEFSDFITIALGINTNEKTIEAKLYPNPSADGKVSVNVNMEAASALSIKITDIKGSVVYSDRKDLGKGLSTVELKGLEQGMYLVELRTEYGINTSKLIVK